MDKLNKKLISPYRLSALIRLQKDPNLALQLFETPRKEKNSFRYSSLSYDLIVEKLGRAKMFDKMESILEQMKQERTRFTPKEIIFCNAIKFYGRSRMPDSAARMFEKIPDFGCQRTIKSVNSLLQAFFNCRELKKMKDLYQNLDRYAVPDACTYNILIKASCRFNSSSSLSDAWRLFDEMRGKKIHPTVVTFGTLISALCVNMKLDEAFRLKDDMIGSFNLQPNIFIYTSLIKGLCKINQLNVAFDLKEEMLDWGLALDSAVYSTLISALYGAGRKREVDGVLKEMRSRGCQPDTVTFNAIMTGFCMEKDFEGAFGVLDEMVEKGCKPDVFTYNILIAGLCKEGKLREATDIFEDMPRRGCFPDVVSYRTLFDGLCDVREFKEAAFFLDEMVFKGYVPSNMKARKFVDGLCAEGDLKLLDTVLNTMAKGSILDISTWEAVVSMLCGNSVLLRACKLVDILIMP